MSAIRIITALIVVLFAGCASIHETRTINKDGSVTVEKSASGWGVGVPTYGYPYGAYGSGAAVIYDRGANRQPEVRVYDTSLAPVLVTRRDRNGNVVQMYWTCGGREPVAGKC